MPWRRSWLCCSCGRQVHRDRQGLQSLGPAADLFTVAKNDGTVVTTEDISQYNEVNGYLTPTEVELKKGDILYFYCFSTADWVSSYSDITVYLNNTDPSILVKPEVVIPEKEEEFVPNVEGASHSATAEFSGENADGLWVYASTTDGVEYTVADHFDTPDWNGDNQPDAEQWYSANSTGLGFNYDVGKDWLEVNVTESAENGGEIMALGFKAPEAGTYTLTVFTQNKWARTATRSWSAWAARTLRRSRLLPMLRSRRWKSPWKPDRSPISMAPPTAAGSAPISLSLWRKPLKHVE